MRGGAARSWRSIFSFRRRRQRSTRRAPRSAVSRSRSSRVAATSSRGGAISCCPPSRTPVSACRRSRTAPSTSMPIADAARANTALSYWSARRWPPPRAWTSAPTAPRTTCALPTLGRSGSSRRRRGASNALRLARLVPERLEPGALGEHLGGVGAARLVEGAGVHLERSLGVAEAALVFAQDLRPDLDVDVRLEKRLFAAVVQ